MQDRCVKHQFRNCFENLRIMKGHLLAALSFLLFPSFGKGQHIKCNRTYDKIGCFKQKNPPKKLFNILVLTDRDWSAPQYSGQEIDWFDWANYVHGFACRCLEILQEFAKESEKKYHHFSVSNYGECWTSEDIIYDFTKLELDETCVGDDFLSCEHEYEWECVGATHSQYVYHVNYKDETREPEVIDGACHVETMTVCVTPSASYNRYVSSVNP